jgi:hypothetical protein
MTTITILPALPMPPSINQQLGVRGGILRKTGKAHAYHNEVTKWIVERTRFVNEIRGKFAVMLSQDPSLALRVDCYFSFPKEKLISKTEKAKSPIKTLDANNRLKSCLDSVSRIIQIDDKHFTTGLCEKVISEDDSTLVWVVISKSKLKTLKEAIE